jgi:hypothetical protein
VSCVIPDSDKGNPGRVSAQPVRIRRSASAPAALARR